MESALYVTDLDAAEAFYSGVLGLPRIAKVPGRHVFFRCGAGVLLLFNPAATRDAPPPDAKLPVPPHGATGPGHLCFSATAEEIAAWKAHLEACGVAIEADFPWPASGGRSIYFRDPSGNSIEFAEPRIWGSEMRDLSAKKIVIASHNAGKLREFADLMAPFGFEAKAAKEFGLPEPEETGTTFEENAYLKAYAAAKATGLPALSDDSGLVVDALDGSPGVYTANWAELPDGSRDFGMAMERTEKALRERSATEPAERTGRFVAVICLAFPDGGAEYFRGEAEGTLVWPPRGSLGFGYDPVFLPVGHDKTFGEMSAEEKHGWKPGQADALSHRARAFQKFARARLGSA
jgi:XTP/dITP diphosphohydrolase